MLSLTAKVLKGGGTEGTAYFILKSSRTEEKSLTRRPKKRWQEGLEPGPVSETVFGELPAKDHSSVCPRSHTMTLQKPNVVSAEYKGFSSRPYVPQSRVCKVREGAYS